MGDLVFSSWKGITKKHLPYIARIIDISTSPVEVVIKKIRLTYKQKRMEIHFKRCEVELQMRTIAQNGEFSLPTPLYRLQIQT